VQDNGGQNIAGGIDYGHESNSFGYLDPAIWRKRRAADTSRERIERIRDLLGQPEAIGNVSPEQLAEARNYRPTGVGETLLVDAGLKMLFQE
jgi:hypothetical protein